MRFLVHKRRSAPAVIIVALVDVLIVLLIFLMVTTTFKQQSALKLALPESSQAKKTGATNNPSFIVNIGTNGVYSFKDLVPKTFEQMKSELISQATKNTNLVLTINAVKSTPWGQIVNVMDVAKEAKIKSVSASVNPKPVKP
jgi:biopolymer transport protein ExbD